MLLYVNLYLALRQAIARERHLEIKLSRLLHPTVSGSGKLGYVNPLKRAP